MNLKCIYTVKRNILHIYCEEFLLLSFESIESMSTWLKEANYICSVKIFFPYPYSFSMHKQRHCCIHGTHEMSLR